MGDAKIQSSAENFTLQFTLDACKVEDVAILPSDVAKSLPFEACQATLVLLDLPFSASLVISANKTSDAYSTKTFDHSHQPLPSLHKLVSNILQPVRKAVDLVLDKCSFHCP